MLGDLWLLILSTPYILVARLVHGGDGLDHLSGDDPLGLLVAAAFSCALLLVAGSYLEQIAARRGKAPRIESQNGNSWVPRASFLLVGCLGIGGLVGPFPRTIPGSGALRFADSS